MGKSMFIGTHDIVLNEKSRIIMPAPFRKDNPQEILEGDFFVTPHSSGYLIIRPKVSWNDYIQAIRQDEELRTAAKKKFERLLYNTSATTRLDKQHRLVLNPKMREALKFSTPAPRQDVKLLGSGDFFEIWPFDLFQAHFENEVKTTADLSEIIDQFEGK